MSGSKEKAASPRPWSVNKYGAIVDATGKQLTVAGGFSLACGYTEPGSEPYLNAKLILDAVNAYSPDKPPHAQGLRAAQPPVPRKPDKFDLAFEIMRQLQEENMDTMQSCQFGYVMRVTRERSP